MTNEEKLKILLDREERAYELLRTLEPTDPAFGTCLDNSHRCMYVRSEIVLAEVDEHLRADVAEPAPEADQEITGIRMVQELPKEDAGEELKGITDYGVGDEPGQPGAPTWTPGGGGDEHAPAPASADAPAQEKAEGKAPATNEAANLTLNDMRDKLTPISIKYGNDLVAEAMNEMGYAKLSGIPAERYGELLSRVEEAVRCRQ